MTGIAALTGIPYTETDLQWMERLCSRVEGRTLVNEYEEDRAEDARDLDRCTDAFYALIASYRKEVLTEVAE